MQTEHLVASIAATLERCEKQEQEIARSRLGQKAKDIDQLQNDLIPLFEEAKVSLKVARVDLVINCGYGGGTTNDPSVEIVCRPMSGWPSRAERARGHLVTVRCRNGVISIGATAPGAKLETPIEPPEPEEPITMPVAAQLALDHAAATLMADAEAKAAPTPTRGAAGMVLDPRDVALRTV